MPQVASHTDWLQQVLLFCGILAPLLYLGTDRLAGTLLKGYSFTAQSVSDLGAAGSSVRSLVVSLTLPASALLIAFGVGVWRGAGQALLPRLVGALLIGNAAAGLVATVFFPNRLGERPAFGSIGVLIMFFSVVFFVLAMVLGAAAFRGWLRVLSMAVPVSYVLLAALRFATASAEGGVGSLIGTQERTMSYSFMLWVMALAIYLLLSSEGAELAGRMGV